VPYGRKQKNACNRRIFRIDRNVITRIVGIVRIATVLVYSSVVTDKTDNDI